MTSSTPCIRQAGLHHYFSHAPVQPMAQPMDQEAIHSQIVPSMPRRSNRLSNPIPTHPKDNANASAKRSEIRASTSSMDLDEQPLTLALLKRNLKPHLILDRPLVIFDTETTGIHPYQDRIVSLAILKCSGKATEKHHYWLINPNRPIPTASSHIHGIFQHHIQDAPDFAKLASTIYDIMNDCYWLAYNARFDIQMLQQSFVRAQLQPPMPRNNPLCGLALQRKYFRDKDRFENNKLGTVYEGFFQRPLQQAHHAKADTTACWHIFMAQLYSQPQLSKDLAVLALQEGLQLKERNDPHPEGLFFQRQANTLIFQRGKHKGKTVEEVAQQEIDYLHWMHEQPTIDAKSKNNILPYMQPRSSHKST